MSKLKFLSKKSRIFFISSFILFTILGFMVFGLNMTNIRKEIVSRSEIELNRESVNIDSNISQAAIDTTIMRNILNKYASTSYNLLTNEIYLNEIKELSINWLDVKIDYDQFRILDLDGNEIIRVNQLSDEEKPYAVEDSLLQNKSDMPYFINAKTLTDGQILISDFNLNEENGSIEVRDGNVIPVFRLTTPLYKNGVKFGYFIYNVRTDAVLDRVIKGDTEIINKDGYYLYSKDHILYGFMNKSLREETYFKYNDIDFSTIDSEYGSNYNYDTFIVYRKISPETINDSISQLSASDIEVTNDDTLLILTYKGNFSDNDRYKKLFYLQFIFILIYFVLAYIFSKIFDLFIYSRKNRLDEFEYIANTDELTKLPNRKKLFIDLKEKQDSNQFFALLYCDIDSFKSINDTFGHDDGDKTLVTLCSRINKVLDKRSKLYRLGGDEFLIVTEIINISELEKLSKAIINEANKPLDFLEDKRTVGISIGISSVGKFYTSTDVLIDQADNAMYKVKNSSKNNFNFHKKKQK